MLEDNLTKSWEPVFTKLKIPQDLRFLLARYLENIMRKRGAAFVTYNLPFLISDQTRIIFSNSEAQEVWAEQKAAIKSLYKRPKEAIFQ